MPHGDGWSLEDGGPQWPHTVSVTGIPDCHTLTLPSQRSIRCTPTPLSWPTDPPRPTPQPRGCTLHCHCGCPRARPTHRLTDLRLRSRGTYASAHFQRHRSHSTFLFMLHLLHPPQQRRLLPLLVTPPVCASQPPPPHSKSDEEPSGPVPQPMMTPTRRHSMEKGKQGRKTEPGMTTATCTHHQPPHLLSSFTRVRLPFITPPLLALCPSAHPLPPRSAVSPCAPLPSASASLCASFSPASLCCWRSTPVR